MQLKKQSPTATCSKLPPHFTLFPKLLIAAALLIIGTGAGRAEQEQNIDQLILQPDSAPIQTATPVKALVRLGDVANVIPASVTLLRYNAVGALVATIGKMYDDGTHGDLVATDHVFTTELSVNESFPQALVFRVSVAKKGVLKRTLLKQVIFAVQSKITPEQVLLEASEDLKNGDMDKVLTHFRMTQLRTNALRTLTTNELNEWGLELKQAILVSSSRDRREFKYLSHNTGKEIWFPLVMERSPLNEWFITVW